MRTLRSALSRILSPTIGTRFAGVLIAGILTAGIPIAGAVVSIPASALHAQERPEVTRETVERWMVDLSNRGRWGANDELGTLNLITPEHRVSAAGLVREGLSVSLSHDYLKERAEDATSPFGHELLGSPQGGFLSDRYTIAYHGYAHSHMDALCHYSSDGLMYNGISRETVDLVQGCVRLGITNVKQGIVTRGILMDIARLKGVEYLEPGTPIYVEDLEAWEEEGITVGPGDVVFVRGGRWARRARRDLGRQGVSPQACTRR